MATTTIKGFIKDWQGNKLLPITRGELVLDQNGQVALQSELFLAKDGHPGLVTAAERAMLSGGTGQSISDVYSKLEYVNAGLKIGDTALHFYDASGATPITVAGTNGVTVATVDNNIAVSLTEINTQAIEKTSTILRGITVDKYGRVTAVSDGALLDADIPQTLSGKILSGCTVAAAPTSDLGIANKKYVDEKVAIANGIATGALKFAGAIGTTTELNTILSGLDARKNNYYKVTPSETLEIDVLNLHYPPKQSGKITLKTGDTLIVYYNPATSTTKFVYIPSADDITSITVYGNGKGDFTNKIGNVVLNFSEVFDVTDLGNTATITLAKASATTDGYLSQEDYAKFAGYETNLAVSYAPTVNDKTGNYTIGTLTIGGTEHVIYGQNNISSLALVDGTGENPADNPILRFTENGTATDTTFKGAAGVRVKKNGSSIEFAADVDVDSASDSYLTAQGNQIGVKLGTVSENGYTDGLVDFKTFYPVLSAVANSVEKIENSLFGVATSVTEYRYGSDAMIAAITLTI